MIVRLVQMTFTQDGIAAFQALFAERKSLIRNSEGCRHLELWQDKNNSQIFFTYSIWADESFLDAYRASDLFRDTWARTKALFADKPKAWTLSSHPVSGQDFATS